MDYERREIFLFSDTVNANITYFQFRGIECEYEVLVS